MGAAKSLLWMMSILVGCVHNVEEHAQVGEPSGATCPPGSVLTYESFGRQFMSDYCTRCHSESLKGAARMQAPDQHNYDTVTAIREQSEHIDQVAGADPETLKRKHAGGGVNTTMPPNDPRPTLEERAKLGEWLACGAR